MRLLSFRENNIDKIGVLGADNTVFDITQIGVIKHDMNELISTLSYEENEKLKELSKKTGGLEYKNITKRAPIPYPKQDIICLGINFLEHAIESYKFKNKEFDGKREFPVYFSKRVNEAVADGDFIDSHEDITDSLDYECELACIIKKDAKNISKEMVDEYIFGWTILNDISARDIQNRHKQWYFGKSLDNTTSIGPWIVTHDEIDTSNLNIKTFINGELRQNSNTNKLIFDIYYVISDLSKGFTLKAGTIISLGTPSGVGMGFVPPKYLKNGDEIICEIQNIGTLSNKIKKL